MTRSIHSAMPTPEVIGLVASSWNDAELALRRELKVYADKDEEAITERFHEKLLDVVDGHNQQGAFERAFVADLRKSHHGIVPYSAFEKFARGIKAKIFRHDRSAERKTGGDLGVVLVRPDVEVTHDYLHVKPDYERGLLCQAKLKSRPGPNRRSKWGSFTKNQEKVLPKHLAYLSLLLYEYSDEARKVLKPFYWQLCESHTFDDVKAFLRAGNFPSLLDSSCVIRHLGEGRIGTDDREIIRNVICPGLRDALRIVIGWDDGDRPQEWVKIHSRQREEAPRLLA